MSTVPILRTLTFVTGNKNKLAEVKATLDGIINVVSAKVDLPELQGDPRTIAEEKCRLAAQQVNGPVITEDTCLCFNALNGLPGPYVKWFMDKIGHDGLNRILAGYEDKSAYALCTFGYCPGPNEDPIIFEGRCPGRIVPARGPSNFGWDPIFEPTGYQQTFAEMPLSIKLEISHRSRALDALKDYFAQADNV
ncbi:inosine triphosphate pyrophosphatase [Syncephalis plumigaleata]|nr:inosine triphosphate pyrophosphatase [Syncephalis plumigaleata]